MDRLISPVGRIELLSIFHSRKRRKSSSRRRRRRREDLASIGLRLL